MRRDFLLIFILVLGLLSKKGNPSGWQEYINYTAGFKISCPEFTKIIEEGNLVRIDFPVSNRTNLLERYILITTSNSKGNFILPVIKGSDKVSINGIDFERIIWEEGVAGSTYYVLQYSSFYQGRYIDIKRCFKNAESWRVG